MRCCCVQLNLEQNETLTLTTSCRYRNQSRFLSRSVAPKDGHKYSSCRLKDNYVEPHFHQTWEITFPKESCQQQWVFVAEAAHENMSFNVEPRASANTHNHVQVCPASQGKTNKNYKKKAPNVHIFAREWSVLMWPARNLRLLPFLKPFLVLTVMLRNEAVTFMCLWRRFLICCYMNWKCRGKTGEEEKQSDNGYRTVAQVCNVVLWVLSSTCGGSLFIHSSDFIRKVIHMKLK